MIATLRSRASLPSLPFRLRPARRRPGPEASPAATEPAVPPLDARRQLIRSAAVIVLVLSTSLVLHFALVSGVQQSSAQQRAFDRLRGELARGVAPIGPDDASGDPLPGGTPVAVLEIPDLELDQVVVEGTTSGDLFIGPGHRRDTPLPGQVGTSAIFGRRAAYGGPFRELGELDPGDRIVVTTGQGTFEYSVIGVRREGDPLPPAVSADSSRLVLATADGTPFIPAGVVRVDADLDGVAVGGAARPSIVADSERLMAGDTSSVWALVLWLQALAGLSVAAVWAWHRWGRAESWIVFLPPLVLVGLSTSGEVARLLPNLL